MKSENRKMYKKLVASLLLLSLSNFLACTSFSVATKDSMEMENEKFTGEIFLVTLGNVRYHFDKQKYYVKNDTLYGNGFEVTVVGEIPFGGAIPTKEIDYIEFKKADTLATLGLVVGIAAAAILILGIIWSVSITNSLSPE
jgi:hypothetical protein